MHHDVAIIGGGPAGATAGTLLKKYNPSLNVAIFEREKFPRDHVGESQLPPISKILDEMGCWDKVEAANFPIKIGATNRWGKSPELWDFEFIPSEKFVDQPRPAKFEGQRSLTAFQVDRAIYDKILLDHATEMGVEVRENAGVKKIHKTGDRIDSIELGSGERSTAGTYVDASGHVGIIRRAMEVDCDYPSTLQNIALWDYWQNADWAVKIGIGGTKIQIMSLGYGWIWFIPLGPTRTSVGLVVPVEYYKSRGLKPEQLYLEALGEEDRISKLLTNATSEHKFATTKDWSFLAGRHSGENWFLTGESSGFADPILSAGMTMAHAAGREVAFTLLEIERSPSDSAWLRTQYDHRQTQRITSHIRFADFWYTANAQFKDIKEFVQGIAKDAGLELTPDKAWAWLAQGGFIDEESFTGVGGYSFFMVKGLGSFLTDLDVEAPLEKYNTFELCLSGATFKTSAKYALGRVHKVQSYTRGDKILPVDGRFHLLINVLQRARTMNQILELLKSHFLTLAPQVRERAFMQTMEALEAMIQDGWVRASFDSRQSKFTKVKYLDQSIHLNRDSLDV